MYCWIFCTIRNFLVINYFCYWVEVGNYSKSIEFYLFIVILTNIIVCSIENSKFEELYIVSWLIIGKQIKFSFINILKLKININIKIIINNFINNKIITINFISNISYIHWLVSGGQFGIWYTPIDRYLSNIIISVFIKKI